MMVRAPAQHYWSPDGAHHITGAATAAYGSLVRFKLTCSCGWSKPLPVAPAGVLTVVYKHFNRKGR